jgi:hypothetical protein
MSPPRNSLGLLADHYHPQRNALLSDYMPQAPSNALMSVCDARPKTEWVDGHYKLVPYGLLGQRYEWIPGYWRRSAR